MHRRYGSLDGVVPDVPDSGTGASFVMFYRDNALGIHAAWSDNGLTWTKSASTFAAGSHEHPIWLGNVWVSIDNLGNLYTSTDGKTWTRNTAFLPDSSYSKIATEGGKHVTVSTLLTTGDQIKYSTDGTNWNNATQVPSGYVFIDVAAGKNVFIAIARSLTDSTKVYAMVSQNMTRWTLSDYIYSGSGVQFTAINYGHNMFVVGTSSSTVPPYRTFTTDGSIWDPTAQVTNGANYTYCNGWHFSLDYGTNKSYRMQNGINWQKFTMPEKCVGLIHGDGKYWAYNDSSYPTAHRKIFHSTDLNSWTAVDTALDSGNIWISGMAFRKYYDVID